MGMSVIPSGSGGFKRVDWAGHGPVMPRGTLVWVLPIGGAWSGRICIVLGWERLRYSSRPWCRLMDEAGNETLLPWQALDVLSYPDSGAEV